MLEINTKHPIVDAPSVNAGLVLTDTDGTRTESALAIEFRGNYSQTFPKKSYELGLLTDTLSSEDQDLSLLGMRTDNKWNLQAMYNDPLRLRIKVANELWQDMNHLYYQAQEPSGKSGIAAAYTELFINGSYQGIYALTERVDRKQLKLKKYTTKITGELYKGVYEAGGALTFDSVPGFANTSTYWGGFEYKEPSEETNWTALHDFVDFVVNSPDEQFYSQYQSRFNLSNAVDYFIFVNLMRATDNLGKNIYLAKYKGGEPYYYVPWDLDGVLGDDWQGLNSNTTDDILTNGFYRRLLQDKQPGGFVATLTSRWRELRATVLAQDALLKRIDLTNKVLLVNDAYEREQKAWPDYQYSAAQPTYAAAWLTARLAYLDGAFNPSSALAATVASPASQLQVYPNPASGSLNVEFGAAPYHASLQDMAGHTVWQQAIAGGATHFDSSHLPHGLYLLRVKNEAATAVRKVVIN